MKRQRPSPLGVLEFTSALNGEDPHLILQKLRYFVHVARYQRRIALGVVDGSQENDVMDEDSDDESVCSLFDEEKPSKRRRLDGKDDKVPAWQMDKNDYRVPFVGTSVAKGDEGNIVVGSWPTGFLEVYQKHSPLGVELLRNEYISASPPNGIHRSLCKGASDGSSSDIKRKSIAQADLTPGQIISLSLQSYYWMALSEWVLGFVPAEMVKRDLEWETCHSSTTFVVEMRSEPNKKGAKCAIPPEIMTILMKQRMPEWIDIIQNCVQQQYQSHQQMVKMQKQKGNKQDKLSAEEQQQQAEKLKLQQVDWEKRQRRNGVLMACALRNLRTMCFVSIGTAREVLRRLLMTGNSSKSTNDGQKPKGKTGGKGSPVDGPNWMTQLLQSKHVSIENSSPSEHCNPQVESLNLLCTLLETKDYVILSRICQAPARSSKQGNCGAKENNTDNLGLLYIALRNGMQCLSDEYALIEDEHETSRQCGLFAQNLRRLLKGVKHILLPISSSLRGDKARLRSEGFILGAGATADLLSGEVLVNLTKLSLLAPSSNAAVGFVRDILRGKDDYKDLSLIEGAAVEARRLLFTLLADAESSPFLSAIRFKERAEQTEAHFAQLSKALLSMVTGRDSNQLMRVFLRTCLATTPQLVPYTFRGLYLSDPKPNYRTLSSLTFVDSVVCHAPSVQTILVSQQENMRNRLAYIMPSCVSRVLLGKVIQSSSALLVSSGLKLIITLLRRAADFISAIIDLESKQSLCQTIINHLPQVSLLLSIPTRFDPFQEPVSQSNSVVMMELCKCIECYAQLDASVIMDIQFDWVRLLPLENDADQEGQSRSFLKAEPCCSVAILHLLHTVSKLGTSSSLKMLTQLMSIVTTAKVESTYQAARELALLLVEKQLFGQTEESRDHETSLCGHYECSLWVDGVESNSILEFVTWIEELRHHRVQHKIFVTQAWIRHGTGGDIPPLCSSMLFSFLISKLIQKGGPSNELSSLLVRMGTMMLMFQNNPFPLASIIAHSADTTSKVNAQCASLCHFATAILKKDENMLSSLDLVPYTVFINNGESISISKETFGYTSCSTALRHCLCLMKYQIGSYEQLSLILFEILAHMFETNDPSIANAAALIKKSFESKDLSSVSVLLLSNLPQKDIKTVPPMVVEKQSKEIEMTRAILQLSSPLNGIPDIINEVMKLTQEAFQSENCGDSLFFADQMCNKISTPTPTMKRKRSSPQGVLEFTSALLQITMQSAAGANSTVVISPASAFALWSELSEHLHIDCAVKLCHRLEDFMSQIFSDGDEQAQWELYQIVAKTTPDLVIKRWLQTTKMRASSVESGLQHSTQCFLSAILAHDCSEFACVARVLSGIENDTELVTLWTDGHLDMLASTFLIQTQSQLNGRGYTDDAVYRGALSVIGNRLSSQIDQEGSLIIKNLQLLQTLCQIGSMPSGLPRKLLGFIIAIQEGSKSDSIDHQVHLIGLIITVCNGKDDRKMLLTHAFVRCCTLVPKLLKIFSRNKLAATSSLLVTLTGHLSSLLEKISQFDQDIVMSCSGTVEKLVVACLKYGIMEADDQQMCLMNGECLKTVRLILNASHFSSTSLVEITPGHVHSMIVSHSSFQMAMSDKVYCEELLITTQQKELILLLKTCVLLDHKRVKVDDVTRSIVMSAYSASTNHIDRLLRELLRVYEEEGCFEKELLISGYRWGSAARRCTDNDEGWDWLLDALDSSRIRSTLVQYPVSDMLHAATSVRSEHVVEKDSPFSDDDNEHEDGDDESQTSSSMMSLTKHSAITGPVCDEWRGSGHDARYSPSFVLPLVLGALEDHLPIDVARSESPKSVSETQETGESYADNEYRERRQSFVHFSRRLCDKGAIALALASLSSRCPLVRKMAVGICGLFLKALQMEEALEIKSWHERPQLELLMSSMQRGLAIRRAMQLKKADEARDNREINTPMLPAASAIFLAKSLMIISRPGDEMYGPINRYFLRSKDFHGAFQDCFTLPAFLSLYCNSSDDQFRCKIERNWALLSLKDGVVDAFCYKIICRSHIPELIMSSLDSCMDNPQCTGEVSLSIEVLSSIIQSGGSRAAAHMIQRLGLLSWLHGIISWRDLSLVLPSTRLRCNYLRLITTAVQAYNKTGYETQFFEKIPLSNAVIRICLATDDSGGGQDEHDQTLLECVCDALWEIHIADQRSHEVGIGTDFIHAQTTVNDFAALVPMFVSHKKMFPKVLSSLCTLPFIKAKEDSSASLFMKLALGYVTSRGAGEDIAPKLLLNVLTRVHELLTIYPKLAADAHISESILKCRKLVVLEGGCVQVWKQIVDSSY